MSITRTLVSLAVCAVVVVSGCESKTPPLPAASNTNSGKPLDNLASNPHSLLGKSAATGKNAVGGLEGRQDEAANAANEISGQSASEYVIGGLRFAIPQGWEKTAPSSQMTAATFKVPAAGNATCNFSTAGGDVASNIARWQGQVTGPEGQKVEGETNQTTVQGIRVTTFKANGTYAGMGGSKTPNTAFRGAIIQAPASTIFIKMTGPADSIGTADAAWERMVTGFGQ